MQVAQIAAEATERATHLVSLTAEEVEVDARAWGQAAQHAEFLAGQLLQPGRRQVGGGGRC